MSAVLSRRSLLVGLAAASTAAASAGAAAAGAAPPKQENARLIELIADLPAIAVAFHEANDVHRAAYKEWDAKTPWAPDELTVRGTGWPYDVPDQPGQPEMKALNGFLWRKGDDCPRRIVVKAWHVSMKIDDARRARRSAKRAGCFVDVASAEDEIKSLKKLEATARDYERRYAEVRSAASAWHKESHPPVMALKDVLERHIASIMDEPDFTMEGLIIKAQALAEWDRVGKRHFDRVAFQHGQNWHGQIAASILRHATGGAS